MIQPVRSRKTGPRRLSALLPAAVMLASTTLPGPGWAGPADPRNGARLAACLASAVERPDQAYEDALVWRARSGGVDAEHCLAVARIELGDVATGAAALARLAGAPRAGSDDSRAELLVKAANAWMLVDSLPPAEAALTRALELRPGETTILTDRARVRMMGGRWTDAEADLDRILASGPDALALRLRAEARMQQGQLDGADADIAAAARLEPDSVETSLVRGRLREARRLGRAPD